jgi:hypothetical protein
MECASASSFSNYGASCLDPPSQSESAVQEKALAD